MENQTSSPYSPTVIPTSSQFITLAHLSVNNYIRLNHKIICWLSDGPVRIVARLLSEGGDHSSTFKVASHKCHNKIVKLWLSGDAYVNCPLFRPFLCDHSSFNPHTPRNPSPMIFTVCGFYRHYVKLWLPSWRNTFRRGHGGHG